jgi:hypothetical protein
MPKLQKTQKPSRPFRVINKVSAFKAGNVCSGSGLAIIQLENFAGQMNSPPPGTTPKMPKLQKTQKPSRPFRVINKVSAFKAGNAKAF